MKISPLRVSLARQILAHAASEALGLARDSITIGMSDRDIVTLASCIMSGYSISINYYSLAGVVYWS